MIRCCTICRHTCRSRIAHGTVREPGGHPAVRLGTHRVRLRAPRHETAQTRVLLHPPRDQPLAEPVRVARQRAHRVPPHVHTHLRPAQQQPQHAALAAVLDRHVVHRVDQVVAQRLCWRCGEACGVWTECGVVWCVSAWWGGGDVWRVECGWMRGNEGCEGDEERRRNVMGCDGI